MFALLIGGSGSGKSALAEALVVALGSKSRYYLATLAVGDAESRRRVKRHREMRKGKGFETIECPLALEQVVLEQRGTALLECMSNLVANEIFMPGGRRSQAAEIILSGVEALERQADHVVIVSNDVFADGVSYSGDMEEYLSVLSEINRRLAARAELVVEVVSGRPVVLKGSLPESFAQNACEKERNMILVTGGAGQGKLAWACEKLQLSAEDSAVYHCESGLPESLAGIQVLDGVHHLVRACLTQGLPPERLVEELPAPGRILTLDEVGCGLVPMDAFERRYREAVGRLGEQLANKAEAVYRMTCGIAQKLS